MLQAATNTLSCNFGKMGGFPQDSLYLRSLFSHFSGSRAWLESQRQPAQLGWGLVSLHSHSQEGRGVPSYAWSSASARGANGSGDRRDEVFIGAAPGN